MPRQDWNIERQEVSRKEFNGLPGVIETLRVRFVMTRKSDGLAIPLHEQNFTTPTDDDFFGYELKLIGHVERGIAAASVTLGVVNTDVVPPTKEQERAAILANALSVVTRSNEAITSIDANTAALKQEFPADATVIEAAAEELKAVHLANKASALDAIKSAPVAEDIKPS